MGTLPNPCKEKGGTFSVRSIPTFSTEIKIMWMIEPEFLPSDIYLSPSVHYMLKDKDNEWPNSNPSSATATSVVQATSVSEQGPILKEQKMNGSKGVTYEFPHLNSKQNDILQPIEVQDKVRDIFEKCKSEQQTLAELANENLRFLEEICNKYKPQPPPPPQPSLPPPPTNTSVTETEEKLPEFDSNLSQVTMVKPQKKFKSLNKIANKYKPQPSSTDGILESISGVETSEKSSKSDYDLYMDDWTKKISNVEASTKEEGLIGTSEQQFEATRIKRKSREIAAKEQIKLQKAVDEQLKRAEEEHKIRQFEMEAKKKDIEERKKAILEAKQKAAAEKAAELEAKEAKKRAQKLAEQKRKEEEIKKIAEEIKRQEEEKKRIQEVMAKKKLAEQKMKEEEEKRMAEERKKHDIAAMKRLAEKLAEQKKKEEEEEKKIAEEIKKLDIAAKKRLAEKLAEQKRKEEEEKRRNEERKRQEKEKKANEEIAVKIKAEADAKKNC